MQPLLIDIRAMAGFDLASLRRDDLAAVDREAGARRWSLLPGLVHTPDRLDAIRDLLEAHATGDYPNLAGFLLRDALRVDPASWRGLGAAGLRFAALPPDEVGTDDELAPGFPLRELVGLLHDCGIGVLLEASVAADPQVAARRTAALIDLVGPSPLLARYPQRDAIDPLLLAAALADRLTLCLAADVDADEQASVLAAVGPERVIGLAGLSDVDAVTVAPGADPDAWGSLGAYGVVGQVTRLRARGFTEAQIESVTGGTAWRVLDEAERLRAKVLQ